MTLSQLDAANFPLDHGGSMRCPDMPTLARAATRHALERFLERGGDQADPLAAMTELLRRAYEIEPHKITRKSLRQNHGGSARYFRSSDWLFVLKGGQVITCWQTPHIGGFRVRRHRSDAKPSRGQRRPRR
jgi:hypothetical protein